VYRLKFNLQELASKYFLQFRIGFNSLPNDIKYHIDKFQFISNFSKRRVLRATNFLLKEGSKSDVSIDDVVNPKISKSLYRNVELGEY